MAPDLASPLAGTRLLVIGAGTLVADIPDPPVGNGRAIAVLAARQGARVVCADLNAAAAQATADWITSEGGEAHVLVGDVSDAERCEALVHEAKQSGVDGVICGHIHFADIHDRLGIQYINTGDWVESCTAIIENEDGGFELIKWTDMVTGEGRRFRLRRNGSQ